MLPQKQESPDEYEAGSYAISLVTYNGEKYLQHCMQSISAQTLKAREYWICDNASVDASVEIIQRDTEKKNTVILKENTGFARGHNAVIRSTRSKYILILNQDLVLDPSYCELLVAFMEQNPLVGSVSGLIIRIGSFTDIGRAHTIDGCGISIAQSQHAYLTHSGRRATHCSAFEEVFGVPATCALYRRSALEDCALDIQGKKEYFDEDFFMYKEDVDLAYRMRLRNWKSYCIPQALCYHVRSAKSSYLVVNRGASAIRHWSYRNHWYVLFKNVPLHCMPFVLIQTTLYEFAKFCYMLFCEPAQLHVFAELWKMRETMKAKRAIIQSRRTCSAIQLLTWMKHIFI